MLTKKAKNTEVHTLIMEQIKDVEACLISFEGFLRAASSGQTGVETLRSLCDSVCQKEAEADTSLRRMIDSLAGTAFLPSTREEIITIATSCDKVANKCEYVARMMVFQQFTFPSQYGGDLLDIVATIHKQFELLEQSISKLFANLSELMKDHSILDEIRKYESDVDAIEQKLYEQVFAMDLDLASRMQIANFVEALCDVPDIIEDIADKIQIMLVTRKV